MKDFLGQTLEQGNTVIVLGDDYFRKHKVETVSETRVKVKPTYDGIDNYGWPYSISPEKTLKIDLILENMA